jgi:metal-responsive CopG/Arc/MetJ family transcriptional regulator
MEETTITIDRDLLAEVEKAGIPLGLTRSQIVRQALENWLTRRSVETFEQEWIAALKKNPDDSQDADNWSQVQDWEDQ